jgi:hypothetical protein
MPHSILFWSVELTRKDLVCALEKAQRKSVVSYFTTCLVQDTWAFAM